MINLQQYRETLIAEVEHEYPLREFARESLNELQQMLGLRNEDVLPIQQEVEVQLRKPNPPPLPLPLPEPDAIASDLINTLFEILSSSSEGKIERFKAIAHKSLFQNGKIKADFLKNHFSPAIERASSYERPIQITESRLTGVKNLEGEKGEEKIYTITWDRSKGSIGCVRLFFPASNATAKVSMLNL